MVVIAEHLMQPFPRSLLHRLADSWVEETDEARLTWLEKRYE